MSLVARLIAGFSPLKRPHGESQPGTCHRWPIHIGWSNGMPLRPPTEAHMSAGVLSGPTTMVPMMHSDGCTCHSSLGPTKPSGGSSPSMP